MTHSFFVACQRAPSSRVVKRTQHSARRRHLRIHPAPAPGTWSRARRAPALVQSMSYGAAGDFAPSGLLSDFAVLAMTLRSTSFAT